MDKIHIVVAECMGTNNEFTSETYPFKDEEKAKKYASALIADMVEAMDVEGIDPNKDWEIEREDEWFYRVRIDTHEIQ